jgi:hypothetical protein
METVFDAPVDPALVDRSLATSRFGSMWLEIPRPQYPPLTGAVSCDLLIVGGGYTGLWSALHAAQRDPAARIVLIEANRIGWAASGRNGGFVDASLTHGEENGRSRWPWRSTRSPQWAWSRCLSLPAGGWPHAPHTTGDGAQAAVALPARTVCQPRHRSEPEGRRRLRGV